MQVVPPNVLIEHQDRHVGKGTQIDKLVHFCATQEHGFHVINYELRRCNTKEEASCHEKLQEDVLGLHWVVDHREVWVGLRMMLPAETDPKETEPDESSLRWDIAHTGL